MVDEFKNTMLTSGIVCREDIIADGQIHRFANHGRGDKDGWYVFHGMTGAFGDWKQDIQGKWSAGQEQGAFQDRKSLHHHIETTARIAETEKSQKQEEVAHTALEQWNSFSETGSSPYLVVKKVAPFVVRFDGESLVVPLRDITGKLWSLQWIVPDGTKRFLAGGRKKGCFHTLGALEDGKPIYVTEGYATGASIHMATGLATIIAFDVGNLEPVVEALRKAYPRSVVTIAGDDDRWKETNIGRTKAEEVTQKYGCSLMFPTFKNTETKPTDFNDLHVLEGIEEVRRQIESDIQFIDKDLPQSEWSDPTPLKVIRSDLSPVIPLPPELIPESYQVWLIDIAERMQCPLDYVAVGAIIVTASLIGSGCGIRPKAQDSWTVIPNLWGGIIGAPSTLKSPALKEILKPLEVLEKEAFEAYEKDQQNEFVESEAYKVTKEVIKKEMAKAASESDRIAMNAAKEKLRILQEPEPVYCKRYSTNDVTIEKMHELLSHNDRGLLLFRDELMGLLASWNKPGHEEDRAFYLEAWNGYGAKTTDRIGRGTIHTKNLCLSLLGSTQPAKLLSYFQQTLLGAENDGLLQRFQLLVYPDESKTWTLIDRKPNDQARELASAIMIKLAKMDFSHYGAHRDETSEIPYFHFEMQAQDVFYEWITELEDKLRNNPDEPILTEHLAKYRKLLPSLALVFHLIEIASGKASGPISVECIERAAGWCEYLETHARRIYQIGSSPSYQAARHLARKIQEGELKSSFDMREVYRKQWTLLKDKQEAIAACHILLDKGWLREIQTNEGGKTKSGYLINPKINQREFS